MFKTEKYVVQLYETLIYKQLLHFDLHMIE